MMGRKTIQYVHKCKRKHHFDVVGGCKDGLFQLELSLWRVIILQIKAMQEMKDILD